jgi:hypothetical protein
MATVAAHVAAAAPMAATAAVPTAMTASAAHVSERWAGCENCRNEKYCT